MNSTNITTKMLLFRLVTKTSFASFKFFKTNYSGMASKNALILLAEGSEEIEVIIPTDVLRRAGVAVTLAGLSGSEPHKCSRDVKLVPDLSLEDAIKRGPFDIVILPGGLGGSKAFAESNAVGALLKEQEASGRFIGAICAAPTALKAHGISLAKKLTSYPSKEQEMLEGNNYIYSKDRVVVDGKLITSQGPGTSFEFAISIVEHLLGKDAAPLILK